MGEGLEQTFLKRMHTNGLQICEKLSSVIIIEMQISHNELATQEAEIRRIAVQNQLLANSS
jgi:hypothetical protein